MGRSGGSFGGLELFIFRKEIFLNMLVNDCFNG